MGRDSPTTLTRHTDPSDYAHTRSEEAKAVLVEAADSLVDRFNPTVGLIRSWNGMRHQEGRPRYDRENMDQHFLVIIDNMVRPLCILHMDPF